MITGRQIREGRELVGRSQDDLAEATGVPVASVIRAEQTDAVPMIKKVNSAAIQRALEIAGVEFAREGSAEPSVCLKKLPSS